MRRCEDEKICEDEKMRDRPPLLEEPCAQTLSGKIGEDQVYDPLQTLRQYSNVCFVRGFNHFFIPYTVIIPSPDHITYTRPS
jgi:hypothetical protein